MADTYANFAALAAAESSSAYAIRTVPVTGATWSSIAIHGGGIEPGSGEMAREVGARIGANHYEFAALLSSGNSRLHITSTNFDEPTALGIVTAARRCLSFHGAAGTTGVAQTFMGGIDTATGARVAAALTAAGFAVTTASEELNASDPANITNRTTLAAGVQLEMSNALRSSFFPGADLSRANRDSGARTSTFYTYAAAVASAYDGRGMMRLGSVNVSRWATLMGPPSTDVDVTVTVATDKAPAGGSHYMHLAGRAADTDNCYLTRIEFTTAATINITVRKRVGGTETLLGSTVATGLTWTAGTAYAVRLQILGSTVQAKVWPAASAEPAAWATSVTDTSITAAGRIGVRGLLSPGSTTPLPVTASWDGLSSVLPQGVTVVRSVNGIVKAHTAAADVRLAQPAIISL
jgi:phage replication-related protein YjqB (UPF0714/DUF867 family)